MVAIVLNVFMGKQKQGAFILDLLRNLGSDYAWWQIEEIPSIRPSIDHIE